MAKVGCGPRAEQRKGIAQEGAERRKARALGAWLYEQQGFAQECIQGLMGHADVKMTEHYQAGHDEKKIEYLEVGAEWRSEVGVLQKFCKSQTTKKGPPFGEPF